VDNELEVIRHQMEEKRASLAEKLGVLEDEVLQTVHQATAAVSSTVHEVTEAVDNVKETVQQTVGTVKDTVQQTVESVKETLDIRGLIREHPWTAVGASFAAGFAGGVLLETPSLSTPSGERQYRQTNGFSSESYQDSRGGTGVSGLASSLTSSLGSAGAEAFQSFKSMAVGTLMGVLNKVVKDAVPASMKADVHQLFEDFNTRLGGKTLYDFESSQEQSPGRYPGG
jgi:ElaB/YqjD/DUF883 family membrane-anchored ribosome-binding protein